MAKAGRPRLPSVLQEMVPFSEASRVKELSGENDRLEDCAEFVRRCGVCRRRRLCAAETCVGLHCPESMLQWANVLHVGSVLRSRSERIVPRSIIV